MTLDWFEIDRNQPYENGSYVVTERADCEGGYLIRLIAYTWDGHPSLGVGITFVPAAPQSGESA